jgi:SAM-dependent methyltransferase
MSAGPPRHRHGLSKHVRQARGTGATSWLTLGLLTAALCLCAVTPGRSQQSTRYSTVPASADGIGKRYMGREIAAVMSWQGAAWLEREEREREERTDLLLKALALKPGMAVADIGAGTGYLSRRMAQAVGSTGSVLAVDVQPEMIAILTKLSRQQGLSTIKPSLGADDDVRLPPDAVDLAILVDVYHELAYPYEVLASIVRALKPGGQLVFIEYRAEDPNVPIKTVHKMTEAQVRREVQVHPQLNWERTDASLPWQHIIVFRKASLQN